MRYSINEIQYKSQIFTITTALYIMFEINVGVPTWAYSGLHNEQLQVRNTANFRTTGLPGAAFCTLCVDSRFCIDETINNDIILDQKLYSKD